MLEGVGMPLVYSAGNNAGGREQRRPMWTQHEKAVLRLLMRQYAGVTEFDPPDVHKHPIRNEMWRLLTARYNAHPHVRSRDTKQLRKAWENLKYRARKLGAESQRNGRQQNNNNNTESSWPLDGITLPGPTTPPPQSATPTPRETGEVSDWRGSEEGNPRNAEEEDIDGEKVIKDEEDDEAVQDSDSLHHSLPLDDRGGNASVPAVLNLHPLVTSLFGGSLGSLATTLPFLASPATSQLATGLLLPHAVSTLTGGDFESGPAILSSSVDSSTTTSSSPTTTVASILLASNAATTTSGPCISTTSEAATITVNGVSPPATVSTFTTTTSASSTTGGNDKAAGTDTPVNTGINTSATTSTTPLSSQDRCQQRLQTVETNMRHTEEQHQAQLQLLRLQMAHSVAEHEAKMRVFGAQLEYWQRKLRVQQRVSYALSAITQNDPDLEDEPLP